MVSIDDLQEVVHGLFKEPIIEPLKFKMAEIRLLKIVKSSYLNEKSPDFDEIWHITADLELCDNHVTKYETFTNSRWQTAAI